MNKILISLSSVLHFDLKLLDITPPEKQLGLLLQSYESKWPYASAQHNSFIETAHYGIPSYSRPLWINQIRDPLKRIVSHYYFFQALDIGHGKNVEYKVGRNC